ncbi:MAG: class I SAM-dependent methyltransferase [Deltaproteobacteria bacterium]|nr:class I SAM-dependent methyltransferase [Deltaproteobacteria bacterium]MBI3389025.1 class I SAM-dependent methyltransferase [Deltaproteobacteria bacterium]
MTDEHDFWDAGGIYRPPTHPVVELFARQRTAYLSARGLLGDVRSLLDVGAGSGFSSSYYPAAIRVAACDYAPGMLVSNPVRDRLVCSAYALPFSDSQFDAVSCWELLHHLDEPTTAIREMLRVARRRVIIFEPNRVNPGHIWLGLTRKNERRCLRFSPRYLRRLVEPTGGRITQHIRCGLLFPNITPLPVARWLARAPFRVPLIAISQLLILEK